MPKIKFKTAWLEKAVANSNFERRAAIMTLNCNRTLHCDGRCEISHSDSINTDLSFFLVKLRWHYALSPRVNKILVLLLCSMRFWGVREGGRMGYFVGAVTVRSVYNFSCQCARNGIIFYRNACNVRVPVFTIVPSGPGFK